MTDTCATNAAVAAELSVQKEVGSPDRQNVRTFFCGDHPFDSFAKAADKVLAAADYDLRAPHSKPPLRSRKDDPQGWLRSAC